MLILFAIKAFVRWKNRMGSISIDAEAEAEVDGWRANGFARLMDIKVR
jgi:hypothetical protein